MRGQAAMQVAAPLTRGVEIMTQAHEIEGAVKVVCLEQAAPVMSPRDSADVLGQAFLERIPLDADGLDPQLLDGFGFDQEHRGIGLTWMRDRAAARVLSAPGELNVLTAEHVY